MRTLLHELTARGLFDDATPGLDERLEQGPITAYCGFDPTADSLHVGNLVPVMGLAWLQRTGGRPLVLIGGGTGMVGDPSGKRSERPVMSVEEIDANATAIRAQLERFLDFGGNPDRSARLYNNADWLRPLSLMEFLRETGKHFTVNYMLQKESVKARLDSGISFTEFAYMLVQAYDFDHLYRTEGCELQLGGSDQWGNITAGIELVGRRHGARVHGLTLPLFTTAAGAKFGKTEEGNVWLDPARTSPYQFYQFWINQDDRDLERLLLGFTFLPEAEIRDILAGHAEAPSRREAQRRLAADLTARVHGETEAGRARAASEILFGNTSIRDADRETCAMVAAEVPTARIDRGELAGLTVVEALVRTGLAQSKSEARRGLPAGGYALNGDRLTEDRSLSSSDLLGDGYVVLQRGRRRYAILVVG